MFEITVVLQFATQFEETEYPVYLPEGRAQVGCATDWKPGAMLMVPDDNCSDKQCLKQRQPLEIGTQHNGGGSKLVQWCMSNSLDFNFWHSFQPKLMKFI